MKRYLIIGLVLLLVGVASWAVVGRGEAPRQREPHPKSERRELREQRRAERLASFEKFLDSLVLTRNWQFNPQTMQQLPAGPMRLIQNIHYNVALWNDTCDVCLPYITGYVPPYSLVVLNYTVPMIDDYYAEESAEGWTVRFTSSLFSASTYTFTFEISAKMGSTILTISNPWYNAVQYSGTISQLY